MGKNKYRRLSEKYRKVPIFSIRTNDELQYPLFVGSAKEIAQYMGLKSQQTFFNVLWVAKTRFAEKGVFYDIEKTGIPFLQGVVFKEFYEILKTNLDGTKEVIGYEDLHG